MDEQSSMRAFTSDRGMRYYEFADHNGRQCRVHDSSLAESPHIWIGEHDHPMHLSQDAVREIIPLLEHFVEHGRLPDTSREPNTFEEAAENIYRLALSPEQEAHSLERLKRLWQ